MRNIILISIDSLRADYCSQFGYEDDTSPFLNKIANEGLNFESAIAPGPSTTQSLPAIFTGRDPHNRENISSEKITDRRGHLFPHLDARDTIPKYLSRNGYSTAGFTPNPYTSRYMGYSQGFDHFEDYMRGGRSSFYDWLFNSKLKNTRFGSLSRMLINWWQNEEVFKPWESYYDEIISWVTSSNEPFFLWVHNMDVHFPFFTPSQYRSQSARDMFLANWKFWRAHVNGEEISEDTRKSLIISYKDSVRYTDDFLRQLFNDTSKYDPIYVIHSDHGEAFGEHGVLSHGNSLYQENIHVPLVIHGIGSGNISSPFSLNSLKEFIKSPSKDRIGDLTQPYVISRTLEDSHIAVIGNKWKVIDEDGNYNSYNISGRYDKKIEKHSLRETGKLIIDPYKQKKTEEQYISEFIRNSDKI